MPHAGLSSPAAATPTSSRRVPPAAAAAAIPTTKAVGARVLRRLESRQERG